MALVAIVGLGNANGQVYLTSLIQDGSFSETEITPECSITFHDDSMVFVHREEIVTLLTYSLSDINKLFFVETVERPFILPNSGVYSGCLNVIIGCTTEDAIIYYTIDGTDPINEFGDVQGNVYSSPFFIYESTTVKTVAVKSGMKNSAVAVATYSMENVGVDYCNDNYSSVVFYPNPVGDNLTIDGIIDESQVFIYSLNGEILMQSQFRERCYVDVSSFKPGCYIVRVGNKFGKFVKK